MMGEIKERGDNERERGNGKAVDPRERVVINYWM
jgi:hypothetical protein